MWNHASKFGTLFLIAAAVAACDDSNQQTAQNAEPAEESSPLTGMVPETKTETETETETAPVDEPTMIPQPQLVNAVESVTLERPAGNPDGLRVKAAGTVATGGWTKPELIRLQHRTGGEGTLALGFVAAPPRSKIVTQAVENIEASMELDAIPAGVTAIRVVSMTNAQSAEISSRETREPETN